MKTTLKQIASSNPSDYDWNSLIKDLACDVEVSIKSILKNNGLNDALKTLECVEGYDREKRLLAVSYAKQVKHLMTDKRSLKAIEVAERYANGLATDEELKMAMVDAWLAYTPYDTRAAAAASALAGASSAAAAAARAADDSAAYGAISAASAASYAAYESAYDSAAGCDAEDAAKKSQLAEFKRMLDCIENDEVYNI